MNTDNFLKRYTEQWKWFGKVLGIGIVTATLLQWPLFVAGGIAVTAHNYGTITESTATIVVILGFVLNIAWFLAFMTLYEEYP